MAHPSTLGTSAANGDPTTLSFGTLAKLLCQQAHGGGAPLCVTKAQYHQYCDSTQTAHDAADFMAAAAAGLEWLIELNQYPPTSTCTPQALAGLLQPIAAQLVAHAAALSATLEQPQ